MIEMYKGVANSPETTITNEINNTDTLIYVLDETRIPAELPNLMVLGTGTSAETVKVLSIDSNIITVERGFQGVAKAWNAGTIIARNFTEYDYNTLVENIKDINDKIGILNGVGEAKEKANKSDFDAHKADMVQQLATKVKMQNVNGVDMNTVKTTGIYNGYTMTNSANSGEASTFIVTEYSPDYIVQTQYIIASVLRVYDRTFYNGTTWSPWVKRTSGRFGSDILCTLQNGWGHYLEGATYSKTDTNIVNLAFAVTAGTVVGGTIVTTLLEGYAPYSNVVIPLYNASTGSYNGEALSLGADGKCHVFGNSAPLQTENVYYGNCAYKSL